MPEPETIRINEVEYVRKDSVSQPVKGDVKIVILQRGWVVVGYVSKSTEPDMLHISKCAVIRRWGTTKGLGEIAFAGPTKDTILEKQPDTECHILTTIKIISCEESKWQKYL